MLQAGLQAGWLRWSGCCAWPGSGRDDGGGGGGAACKGKAFDGCCGGCSGAEGGFEILALLGCAALVILRQVVGGSGCILCLG